MGVLRDNVNYFNTLSTRIIGDIVIFVLLIPVISESFRGA